MNSEFRACHYGSKAGMAAAGFMTDPVSLIVGDQIMKAYTPRTSKDPKSGGAMAAPAVRQRNLRALAPVGSGS